jgi:hypothetical protein
MKSKKSSIRQEEAGNDDAAQLHLRPIEHGVLRVSQRKAV